MKDVFTIAFRLMLQQYQISYQLFNSNHALVRLRENWKNYQDNRNFVVTVFIGLSKAFDYVLHDLRLVKLPVNGSLEDVVTSVHSDLKRRKQGE